MKMLLRLATCAIVPMVFAGHALAFPKGSAAAYKLDAGNANNDGREPVAATLAWRQPQAVTRRAPAATDDSTAGYAIGDLWNYNGVIFQALQVGVKQATWAPVPAARGLPADVVATPSACYGSRALNSAWMNGNWIDVASAAGGLATTIKFINGEPDLESLQKVTAGGLGYISRWYDQCGAALDATQAEAANQPIVRADITTGGAPSVVFDSVINPQVTTTQKYLILPSLLTVSASSDSVILVGRAYTSRRGAAFVQLNSTSQTQSLSSGCYHPKLTYSYGLPYTAPVPASVSEGVGGWISSGSGQTVFWGNATASYPAKAANTMFGGYIGQIVNKSSSILANGQTELSAMLIYGRGLDRSERITVQAALIRLFPHFPQVQNINIDDGDSITEGLRSTALQNRSRKTLVLYGDDVRVINEAVSGSTTERRIADYHIYVEPWFNVHAQNNTLTFSIGSNDCVAKNATARGTYDSIAKYLSLAHRTGFRVVSATILPRGDANAYQNSCIAGVNTLLRANSGGSHGLAGRWDSLADIAADPTMGAAGATANTALFADGIHPTDLGYSLLAPIYAKARSAILR